ncbi:MAG: ABC transporter substrate-binding protein [Pseudomonadota bacterium]
MCGLLLICLFLAAPSWALGADERLLDQGFEGIVASARGGTVRFFMFGGFANVNRWIDSFVAPEMKKRYAIAVERVPMDPAVFMNKLLTEKAAGKDKGTIDLLWINGENFKNARRAGLLFGPFAEKLPNFQKYVDPETVRFDFGFPVSGYEAPYGRAQFVLEYDQARTPEPPRTLAALREWIKSRPGRFTYPRPPDFTGSAFVRQVFYAVTGGPGQYLDGYNPALFHEKSPRLWDFLNEIKPGLWQEGRAYPQDAAALDTLFSRGEVDFSMSYHPSHAQSKILEGTYPETARTLVLAEGSIFNTHFTAIPANAVNKAAALVLADFLLSPEAQLSKFDPANWGDFPALDLARLPDDFRARFAAVDLGPATLPPATLARAAVPEIPSQYLEALETGWDENVLK